MQNQTKKQTKNGIKKQTKGNQMEMNERIRKIHTMRVEEIMEVKVWVQQLKQNPQI